MRGLVIIPARGGSKGIPNKNIRFLAGKPLIYYTLKTVASSVQNLEIYVSTESRKIRVWVEHLGFNVIDRPINLSTDESTVDEVIIDAYSKLSSAKDYDYVLTIQPTSPLLSTTTLDSAIEMFLSQGFDTLISCVNNPHLFWLEDSGKFIPNTSLRKNRQFLQKQYIETGAFVLSKISNFNQGHRIAGNIGIFEIPFNESIDIDNYNDWSVAERLMLSKKITIFTEGFDKIGLGHVYRTMHLYEKLYQHDIQLITTRRSIQAIKKFNEENLPYIVIDSIEDVFEILEERVPDIFINDFLNTSSKFIKKLKSYTRRVVSFEDLGSGSKYCHAVINDLYEYPVKYNSNNFYWGSNYFLLRDEFFLIGKSKFTKKVSNILVVFGGTDPSNLNFKLADVAIKLSDRFSFTFLVGGGYGNISGLIKKLSKFKNITITNNSNLVSRLMQNSQIAISSQGRTMLELAYIEVPTILLAQNKRELEHSFGYLDNGFINLGLGKSISTDEILNTILWLADSTRIRMELRTVQSRFRPEHSFKRVERIILGE